MTIKEMKLKNLLIAIKKFDVEFYQYLRDFVDIEEKPKLTIIRNIQSIKKNINRL